MSSGSVTYKGRLLGINQKEFDANLQATLNAIGVVGVEIMREEMLAKLPHGDYTGDTRKSVMFMTKNTPGKPEHNESDEVIDTPDDEFTVYVGSAHPNAFYMEYGTPRHRNKEGSAEFIEAIRQWMVDRGIDKKYLYPIVKKIREMGTEARPYATETATRLAEESAQETYEAVVKFLATRQYEPTRKRRVK